MAEWTIGLVALVVTAALVPLIRKVAIKGKWVHRPDPKKEKGATSKVNHPCVIAMGGGLAIFAGVLAAVTAGGHSHVLPSVLWLTGSALLLGLWDDLKDCRPVVKLAVQTLLGGLTLLCIGWVHGLPTWLAIPVTVFGVVGLMNSVNLMDNMDGTASGLMVLAMLGYAWLGIVTQNSLVVVLSLAIAGACLGFWLYNKPPACIFMGDTGSMMLGYLLAVVGTLTTQGEYSHGFARLFAPFLLAGLFIADTTFRVVWRKTHGLPITRGDRNHLSYRLAYLLGLSEWRANGIFYAVQVGLVVIALGIAATPLPLSVLLFLLGSFGLFLLAWRLWQVKPETVGC